MNFLGSQNTTASNYLQYIPVGVIVLIVFIVIIVFASSNYGKKIFQREKDYIYKTDMFSNTSKGLNNAPYVEMLTPSEVSKYITNNFTLTFFINMNSIGLQINNDVPLINFGDFGTLTLNPVTNTLNLNVNVLYEAKNTSNDPFNPKWIVGPGVISITANDFTPMNWIQYGIVCEGRTVKLYRNGMFTGSTLLTSLPASKPNALLFNTGSNIPGTIAYVHAYARAVDNNTILSDYSSMIPTGSTAPQPYTFAPSLTVDDLTNTFKDTLCKVGICAPVKGEDDLRLGPINYINYEYA